jgi:DNA helicase-2/ATP-dependent DNA helicase PcrA
LFQQDPNTQISRVVLDALFAEISWAKVSLIDHQHYVDAAQRIGRQPPQGISRRTFAQIYAGYESFKFEDAVMDFNDILLLNCHLINQYEQVREAVRRRYRYITVDEFQDVSPLQQLLLDLWLGPNQNICVVGDPNQTIYSFAGASPRYLLNFTRKYPQATTVELDINYRSTPAIIALANQIVKGSPGTIVLKSNLSRGPKISFETFDSDREEARGVAQAIQNLSAVNPDQTAILVRTNFSTAPLMKALRAAGLKAYDRSAEFRTTRGLIREGSESGQPANLPADPKLARQVLVNLGYAPPVAEEMPVGELIEKVISRYADTNSVPPDSGQARPNAAHSGPIDVPGAEIDPDVLAPELQLTPLASESAPGGVSVMTIHSAKGLEFKNVFVMGLFQGGIPYFEATSPVAVEEERRLFYVAITRAQSRLFLSYALSKHGGAKRPRPRSIFLDRLWPR